MVRDPDRSGSDVAAGRWVVCWDDPNPPGRTSRPQVRPRRPLGHPRHRRDRQQLHRGGQARTRVRGGRRRVAQPGSADGFAARHAIPRSHASYAALVADPEVDVVYVASPHSEHLDHALLAIEAGKHVLVEKAFTVNAEEAARVVAAARAPDVFVMEAMWTRFLPHVVAVREVLARGEIGELARSSPTTARMGDDPETHRLHDRALAGGALLDLGRLPGLVRPRPVRHARPGLGHRCADPHRGRRAGVDRPGLRRGPGQPAHDPRGQHRHHRRRVRNAWPDRDPGQVLRSDAVPRGPRRRPGVEVQCMVDTGLQYEAAEVARRVAEGVSESPLMTWEKTLEVLRTMDTVRRRSGSSTRTRSSAVRTVAARAGAAASSTPTAAGPVCPRGWPPTRASVASSAC